jgi:hypothetical protein
MTYTYVFGGATVYPAEISYAQLSLTADVALSWPEETSASSNLAAKIMDVTADQAGLKVILPDAAKAGVGETILFNNIGSYTVTISDYDDVQVVTIAAGELWQIYLTDNSTSAGSWRSLQYGASISQANASSLAGTGIVAVGTLLSQSVPVTTFNSDYTAGISDRAKMYNWTGAGGVLTLPSAQTVGNNWFIYLRNSGSGQIVATPVGINTIDGAVDLAFQPNESAIIASDGTDFYTIGFGQSATFAFDYTVINVAGTGNYTLTGTELNRIAYNFTGLLTGDRLIVVPDTVQQYWVTNSTTGAFTLSIGTAAGAFVDVPQNSRAILYCDGVDVVDADTSTVSFPILVSQGGTGSTTASGARINLGSTSVGDALFTAVDQAAAWAALGVAQSGNVDGGSWS